MQGEGEESLLPSGGWSCAELISLWYARYLLDTWPICISVHLAVWKLQLNQFLLAACPLCNPLILCNCLSNELCNFKTSSNSFKRLVMQPCRIVYCRKNKEQLLSHRGLWLILITTVEINPSRLALQPIEGQGLPTNCWPHLYLSADRGERKIIRPVDDDDGDEKCRNSYKSHFKIKIAIYSMKILIKL